MTLDIILFRKKSKLVHTLTIFSFLSTCYLVSLINGYILHYRCLKMEQSNLFCGPNYGLTVLTAFSGNFQLNLFVVLLLFFLAA